MKTLRSVVYLAVVLALLVPSVAGAAAPQAAAHNPDSIVRWTEDWPTYIDPAVGNDFSDCQALVNIYDSLVFPKLDGSIAPALATEWSVSPDNLEYTFKLRPDVKFHNGKILTADDVVFSTNRLLTIGEGFAYLLSTKDKDGNLVSGIKSVEAVDANTVKFTLAKPFGPFVAALVRLYILNKDEVMAHIDKNAKTTYGDMGDYGKTWLLTNDAGSGPYMVKEVKMEEYVIGEKFDDWWGGWDKDAPDFFKESAYPGEVTVRTLMKNRELEISSETLPQEGYRTLEQIDGISATAYLAPHNLQIMLNTKVAPTDDVHFRRALAYATDYNVITTDIWPAYKQAVGPVPQTLPGANPNTFQFTRDLEKAKAELAQSKYANELDKYTFSLSWCAEVPDEERVALLFQSNAADLGINVEIFKKPFGSMIADAQSVETTPNGSVVYVAAHYNEAGSMLETRYHSKSQGTWEQCEWLGSPEVDAAIEDALATVDQKARFEKYQKIQDMIVELCPTIWLADQAQEFAYQDYIEWPVMQRVAANEPVAPVMGYSHWMHDVKMNLDRRAELLNQ